MYVIMYGVFLTHIEPEIPDLIKFVIPKITADWETVAYFLKFKPARVKMIKEECLNNQEKCCREVFIHWLDSKEGAYPKTWEKLIETLSNITELAAATEKIKEHLEQGYAELCNSFMW